MSQRIDALNDAPFVDGPLEFVCQKVVDVLKASEFSVLFGTSIDAYQRMDYSMRELPALRVYNQQLTKEFESWFIEGDILIDCIFPASLRRNSIQQIQDTVSAALLQQFRRPSMFDAVASGVPGLNELGKTFTMDKALGFEFGDQAVPLTQIRANVRLDLRQWDLYLEETDRTKDTPFAAILGDLETFKTQLDATTDE
jgi:hypothetical protein